MAGAVDVEFTVVLDGGSRVGRRSLHPAQDGAYAGLDDRGAGGLDDVVVRARVQADDDVQAVAEGGQHDDRHLAGLADAEAYLDAVHGGQHQIEQQEIGAEGVQGIQAGLAGGGGEDLVPA